MPNYIETESTSINYRRCRAIYINNQYNSAPSVEFIEQDVAVVNTSDVFMKEVGSLREVITTDNMNTEFPIVDQTTLEPIPGQTTTYATVMWLLRSAYIYFAKKRDAEQV